MADVLWSVCLSVSVCEWDTLLSHAKMIESIPDAIWAVDSSVSKEPHIGWRVSVAPQKGDFFWGGAYSGMPRLACSQYNQHTQHCCMVCLLVAFIAAVLLCVSELFMILSRILPQ